ncbi:methyl-accepting chemotaxis protein [Actinoplanes tereljensis]|uniref:Methyl-accepting chemotaxis protein n=1 Tax=Paractinoplanes tereljensis TaxID=571912 RepID=A0A919NMH5_9ACTN|nr:methyl-accepting chemotaxis protein [Actinoplanes tereljensis]GIF21526.1 hypothetical protein Ate02nite_42560 [Actinoplanes tereljensis]
MPRRTFEDLSVKFKIVSAIVVAIVVTVIVGVTGVVALRKSSTSAELIYSSNVASIRAVGQLKSAIYQTLLASSNQAISQNATQVATYTKSFTAHAAEFGTAMTAYQASQPAGDQTTIANLQTAWDAYLDVATNKLLPAGVSNSFNAWATLRESEVVPLMTKITTYITELDQTETADAAKNSAAAGKVYRTGRDISIAVVAIGAILVLVLGVVVARRIVRALNRVKGVCDTLAAGDLTQTSGLTSRDEPGQMAQALDTAIGNLRHTVQTIDASASALSGAADRMNGTAARIAGSAEEGSTQAQVVSAAAEEVSRSVETVSAGSEQMGASIREISENASEAARVAAEAVTITSATSTTMNKLGDSSAEIGNVIKVITQIAEQTNLLALNATIEAARAGEAGKGFAVVASEVKDLAQETARATEDISRRVEAIQADTVGAVTAIEEISNVIARISDFQTTIASAVEEQTATTAEMSRSVSEAATGANEIAQKITGVAQAALDTSEGVAETQEASTELARMSGDLTSLVSRFRF